MGARHQLTARRKAAGYSQEGMAERLGVNPSTYNRWEVGRVTPHDRHRPPLAEILDLTLDEVDLLLDNRLETIDGYRISAHRVPMSLDHYASLEHGADRIDTVELRTVPGLLQSRRYAAAVIRSYSDFEPLPEREVRERIGLRLARQRVLERAPSPPDYRCIIDESALYRVVGSAEVMAEQLDRLVELADRPWIEIRVLSARSPALCAHTVTGFTLFHAGGAGRPHGVASDDVMGGTEHRDNPGIVDHHVRLLDFLRGEALSPGESGRAILRARGSLA